MFRLYGAGDSQKVHQGGEGEIVLCVRHDERVHGTPPILLDDQMTLVWKVPPDDDDTSPYRCEVSFHRDVCAACGVQHVLCMGSPRRVHDVPFGDHPVILEFAEGYTRCPKTGEERTYQSPVERCTDRLIRYLQRRHGQEPHRAVAQRVGLTPSMVLRKQKQVEVPAPQREVVNLGLDDLYIFKQRFVVATDLTTGKLLLLVPGAPMIEGKADQVDFRTLLKGLPTPTNVAVDMHQEQLDAVRDTWPEAKVVIDKRHVLQTIDRDLIALVGKVVMLWRGENSETSSELQALRPFGAAAYPYLALRTLVLRRQARLTPADHAAWVLLRREGKLAEQLWEAYQWREALYDIYDERLTGTNFKSELERWRSEVRAWHTWLDGSSRSAKNLESGQNRQQNKVSEDDKASQRPLRRILWVLTKHWNLCAAYGDARLTNARTELVNAKIRRYVRQGHRYDPATLMALINRDVEQSQSSEGEATDPSSEGAAADLPLAAERWVRADPWPGSPDQASRVRSPADQPFPEGVTISTVTPDRIPASRPRGLPALPESMELPEPVWVWLHSAKDSKRRQKQQSLRWYHVIQNTAPTADGWAWRLLCQGKQRDEWLADITSTQLTHWRLSVLFTYFKERESARAIANHESGQNNRLTPTKEDPLFLFYDLKVDRLVAEKPALASGLARVWCRLVDTSYGPLSKPDQDLLEEVSCWHRPKIFSLV